MNQLCMLLLENPTIGLANVLWMESQITVNCCLSSWVRSSIFDRISLAIDVAIRVLACRMYGSSPSAKQTVSNLDAVSSAASKSCDTIRSLRWCGASKWYAWGSNAERGWRKAQVRSSRTLWQLTNLPRNSTLSSRNVFILRRTRAPWIFFIKSSGTPGGGVIKSWNFKKLSLSYWSIDAYSMWKRCVHVHIAVCLFLYRSRVWASRPIPLRERWNR